MQFTSTETGAVTVDWVVLTAGLVGLGLAAVAVVSGGVEDASNDISNQLSSGTLLLTAFTRPGGVDLDFETMDGVTSAYVRDHSTVGISDALGSVSGDNALVINFGSVAEHQGFRITPDQEQLVVGGTYRISYWARTDGDAATLMFSHQSGSGQSTELNHNQDLTDEWTQYTREFTLSSNESHLYGWTTDQDIAIAVDDLVIERIDRGN